MSMPERIRIAITPSQHVTAIAYPAAREPAGVSLLLAHGAGADQASAFMVRFASALAARGFDTITFNFLYSEERRRVPDRNDALEACWCKVIAAFRAGAFGKRAADAKLVIGGKSMGGRIASQVAAKNAAGGAGGDAGGIAGLVLLGYPLHPPGRPDKPRTKHLAAVRAPMLFVQGSRDAFGTPDELRPVIATLKAPADLYVVEGGDHSYKVAKRSGPPQEQVYESVLDEIERWLRRSLSPAGR
jgi:uncharacterized protein